MRRYRTTRSATTRTLGSLVIVALLGACNLLDRALNVEAPGVVDARDVATPANAPLIVSGAIADFECALGAYIVNGGLLGNELRDGSVTAARFPLDQRTIDASEPYGVNSCAGNPPGIYVPLATAIWTSNNALMLLQGWTDAEVPDRQLLMARAAAYSGYSHVLLGEGFCTAVIDELGPEAQPDAVFQRAVERFGTAVTAATAAGDDDMLNLAQLGRARALVNLGQMAQAAADAQAVLDRSPTYVKQATASTASSRRWNRVGDEFWGGRITVELAYRDVRVDTFPDPRVTVINTNTVGHDNVSEVWLATKIGPARIVDLREEPLNIATWREAHLILAEAATDPQVTVQHINDLRTYWQLPQFASSDPVEIQQQLIIERSRELFLEGHHLGDLRRFDLPLVPPVGDPYRQGGLYGSVRCFELPDIERDNNPNIP